MTKYKATITVEGEAEDPDSMLSDGTSLLLGYLAHEGERVVVDWKLHEDDDE